ncbi:transcription factor egl-13-like [Argiope bruennichi]|uniref:transcription factor egl-13-like n=1 Tax=Argiope bruennichi TaxID=94029 RepID=UPI0024957F7B|nr:transcription factor egl-13-like [Argiope bruennichi]
MEYDKSNRVDKRKVLSERNTVDARNRQPQGTARFPGISNSKNAFSQSGNGHFHLVSSGDATGNEENQKESYIDLSRVKKEPRVNIHKLEKKKEEEPRDSQNDENSATKRKKVENPENDTSFDADSEMLNDMQDTRMPWDENAAFEFGDLSPSLTDLIFKPRPNKICRPPNAFMLFAKEHRRQVGMDHPDETNRQISIILGNMWRDLSDEDKMKYYKEAQALEKLHKETYPSYVYSPNEARMRKQSKAERKQKLKETPPSSKTFFVSEDSGGSPQSSKDAQDVFL